jgi:hypothetical protein
MPRLGQTLTEAQKAVVREGTKRGRREQLARRRSLALIFRGELERLIKSGTIAPGFETLPHVAASEASDLKDALGGADALSPQQALVIGDLVSVGIVLRAMLAAFLQKPGGDPDLASRIGTLVSTRRSSVALLGLARVALDIPEELSEARLAAAAAAAGYDFTPSGESVEPSGGPSAPERTLSGSVVTS